MDYLELNVLSMTGVVDLDGEFDTLAFAMHFDQLDKKRVQERVEIVNFAYGDCGGSGFYSILEFKFDRDMRCKIFSSGTKIQFTGARDESKVRELVVFLREDLNQGAKQLKATGLQNYFYDLYIDEETNVLYSVTHKRAVGKKLRNNDFYVFHGKRCEFSVEEGAFVSITGSTKSKKIVYTPDLSSITADPTETIDLEIGRVISGRLDLLNYRIVNIWSNCRIPIPAANLETLAAHIKQSAGPAIQVVYDPTLYKGINVRIFSKPGGTKLVSIIIKSTGFVIVTGSNLFSMQHNFNYFCQTCMPSSHSHDTRPQQQEVDLDLLFSVDGE